MCVIDLVYYCLLQQKYGYRVGRKPHFGVGTRSSQARVGVEMQNFTGLLFEVET